MVLQDKTSKILRNLPEFLEHSGNNYDFINSFSEDFQSVTDNIDNLKSSIQLSTATGLYLNDIGMLFKLTRIAGESDGDFRSRIKSFWQGNTRGGIKQALLDTITSMTNLPESSIDYDDSEDMIIKITATIPGFSVSTGTVITALNQVKAAGIYLLLTFTSSLTDTYKNYTENIIISDIVITTKYIIGDYWIPDEQTTGL